MQTYLAAHDNFVAWLDTLSHAPSPTEVGDRLRALAVTAAARGMTGTHWTFVVDGLVAYTNRRYPGDILLSSDIARGFDLVTRWSEIQAVACLEETPRQADTTPTGNRC